MGDYENGQELWSGARIEDIPLANRQATTAFMPVGATSIVFSRHCVSCPWTADVVGFCSICATVSGSHVVVRSTGRYDDTTKGRTGVVGPMMGSRTVSCCEATRFVGSR